MKVAAQLASGEKPSGAAQYLGDAKRLCSVRCPAESAADFLRPDVQQEALSARAARLVVGNGMRIQGAKNFEKGGEHFHLTMGRIVQSLLPMKPDASTSRNRAGGWARNWEIEYLRSAKSFSYRFRCFIL